VSKENNLFVGSWLVELDGLSIQNKHQRKDLDSKVMQLLIYLLRNRDRVVTREELLEQLWKNQVVSDDVLNVAISSLRKAFGDDFKSPTYIKTLPKKGYQLIASVEAVSSNSHQNNHNWKVAGLVLLTIIFLIWGYLNSVPETISPSPTSQPREDHPIRLAVLPFKFHSSLKNREYIADGLTEAIINRLVRESNLQVTSRISVMQYREKMISVAEIAEQLKVDWILEGSVQLEGDRLLVTAQLIDAINDSHVWSETYQKHLTGLFEIQAEVSAKMVSRLNLSSNLIKPTNSTTTHRQIPAEAYDSFLRAQYYHYKSEDNKALEAYQQAIDRYPLYAEAYAHLSHIYFSKAYSSDDQANEYIDMGSKLAIKAFQIDSKPAYVQLVMGLTYLYKDYDYLSAGKAFELAFERNNQDLMILEWFAEYLLITKQFDRVENLAKHMMTISPLAYNKITAYRALFYRGEYRKAELEITNKAAIISVKSRELLYVRNSLATDNDEALMLHMPLFLKELQVSQKDIDEFTVLLESKGRSRALSFIVERVQVFNDYDKAKLYALAGESEKAIKLLQSLATNRNIQVLKLAIEPSFKLLGNEPGFLVLLKQLNLN